jgi:hypothetical protein
MFYVAIMSIITKILTFSIVGRLEIFDINIPNSLARISVVHEALIIQE